MKPSSFLLQFLRQIESLRTTTYLDAAGLPTIGYGHLIQPGEMFTAITRDEAEALLVTDVERKLTTVTRLTTELGLLAHEVDALTSLVYNIGVRNFEGSTLLRRLRENDRKAAAHQFRRWCFAGGRPLPGLRRRRVAEELWFLGGNPSSVLEVLAGRWA